MALAYNNCVKSILIIGWIGSRINSESKVNCFFFCWSCVGTMSACTTQNIYICWLDKFRRDSAGAQLQNHCKERHYDDQCWLESARFFNVPTYKLRVVYAHKVCDGQLYIRRGFYQNSFVYTREQHRTCNLHWLYKIHWRQCKWLISMSVMLQHCYIHIVVKRRNAFGNEEGM